MTTNILQLSTEILESISEEQVALCNRNVTKYNDYISKCLEGHNIVGIAITCRPRFGVFLLDIVEMSKKEIDACKLGIFDKLDYWEQ